MKHYGIVAVRTYYRDVMYLTEIQTLMDKAEIEAFIDRIKNGWTPKKSWLQLLSAAVLGLEGYRRMKIDRHGGVEVIPVNWEDEYVEDYYVGFSPRLKTFFIKQVPKSYTPLAAKKLWRKRYVVAPEMRMTALWPTDRVAIYRVTGTVYIEHRCEKWKKPRVEKRPADEKDREWYEMLPEVMYA